VLEEIILPFKAVSPLRTWKPAKLVKTEGPPRFCRADGRLKDMAQIYKKDLGKLNQPVRVDKIIVLGQCLRSTAVRYLGVVTLLRRVG
jgi:hypothetical protein